MSDRTWLDTLPPAQLSVAVNEMMTNPERAAQLAAAGGDPRFAVWLVLVDSRMIPAVGVDHSAIPDWGWRDAFDSGLSPRQAARQGLDADGRLANDPMAAERLYSRSGAQRPASRAAEFSPSSPPPPPPVPAAGPSL